MIISTMIIIINKYNIYILNDNNFNNNNNN